MRFVSKSIHFARDRRGVSSMEYGLIAALMAIAVLGTAASFRSGNGAMLNLGACAFQSATSGL